jgi:hypothetical protein
LNLTIPTREIAPAPTGKKKRANKEAKLCILINDYARPMLMPGVWFGHWPNEGRRALKTRRLMKAMGISAGAPDYIAISPGGLHAIEVKLATSELFGTKKTYPTKEQREFGELWAAAGGFYKVVRSLDEAKAYLEHHGITRADKSFIPAKGRGT